MRVRRRESDVCVGVFPNPIIILQNRVIFGVFLFLRSQVDERDDGGLPATGSTGQLQ